MEFQPASLSLFGVELVINTRLDGYSIGFTFLSDYCSRDLWRAIPSNIITVARGERVMEEARYSLT